MALEVKSIKAKAEALGFYFSGFTKVQQSPHFPEYLTWLKKERYGNLKFLAKDYIIESRRDPEQLLRNAKSIIVLGVNYGPSIENIQDNLSDKGVIATYAQYDDYHYIIKTKANKLMESINSEQADKVNYRIYIDSGPLMEKDFAYAAGLGWIGKNSLFIHPTFGSFTFLCCILVDTDLDEKNMLSSNLCGNCRLCEQACPTKCINGDHTIDAGRCISYLTIEHKGIVPKNLRPLIGNHVFGCDICQNVCPFNTMTMKNQNELYFGLEKKNSHPLDLLSEMSLTEEAYKEKFSNTPVLRISFEHYLRNIIIASGNSHNRKFIKPLKIFLSNGSEIIRAHAAWALGEIGLEESFSILRTHLAFESNDLVRNEILSSLK